MGKLNEARELVMILSKTIDSSSPFGPTTDERTRWTRTPKHSQAGQARRYREEAHFEEIEVLLSLFQHLKERVLCMAGTFRDSSGCQSKRSRTYSSNDTRNHARNQPWHQHPREQRYSSKSLTIAQPILKYV